MKKNETQFYIIFFILTISLSLNTYAQNIGSCDYYSETCTKCDNGEQYGECLNISENIQPYRGESCEVIDNNCIACEGLAFVGCGPNDTVEVIQPTNVPTTNNQNENVQVTNDQCEITMCLAGGLGKNSPTNNILNHFCGSTFVKNPIQQCIGDECRNIWSNAGARNRNFVYPALFEALDFNGDGVVNNQDPKCTLKLIGYSWGGVNSIVLSRFLSNDQRVDADHKIVDHIITIDAYQPFVFRRAYVPPTVKKADFFLRSEVPNTDCSINAIGGPYKGLYPRCTEATQCKVYDWSQLNEYIPYKKYGYSGNIQSKKVGHCTVVGSSLPVIEKLLLNQIYNGPLPQSQTPALFIEPM